MASFDRDLLLDIYDLVVEPDGWPQILERVADSVGARGCIVFDLMEDMSGGQILQAPHLSPNYDPVEVNRYIEAFSAWEIEDQRVFARHSAVGDRIDLIGDEVLAETPEILASRPNSMAMAEFGILHRAGALLSKDEPLRNRFSIQFSRSHGPLGPADQSTLADILPHLAKACEIARPMRQLELGGTLLADALNRLRLGVCLIRSDGAVLVQNDEFRRQLEEVRLFRVSPDGRLSPAHPRDAAWFREMTGAASRHGRFGARPRKEALGADAVDGPALAVEIAPLTSPRVTGERNLEGFLVCSLDTTRSIDLDLDMVEKVLGLTGSESALIELMADGLTNRQIAHERDRSIETVNTQVKGLFAKTSCANRTQLIRKVSSIGANFVRSGSQFG
ncbi:MAG: helix-turn-helix transcriptional regulator [Nitratireductor sp.]|nr:helix-turn-helix transcriptional regulator [Nitratireductor sp.]